MMSDDEIRQKHELDRSEPLTRKEFAGRLWKWSRAALAAAVGLGLAAHPSKDAEAGAWINNRGGWGGAWVNGGGAWINGGGWINAPVGGGSWVNSGGGSWVNRRGGWGGSWINR